jgi:hypothetical protein
VALIAGYAHLGPFSRRVIEAIDGRLAALEGQISDTMADSVSLAKNTA